MLFVSHLSNWFGGSVAGQESEAFKANEARIKAVQQSGKTLPPESVEDNLGRLGLKKAS